MVNFLSTNSYITIVFHYNLELSKRMDQTKQRDIEFRQEDLCHDYSKAFQILLEIEGAIAKRLFISLV